jgi:hypothetical protein
MVLWRSHRRIAQLVCDILLVPVFLHAELLPERMVYMFELASVVVLIEHTTESVNVGARRPSWMRSPGTACWV